MNDLNCPNCGTTYQSSKAGFCDCCGFEFTQVYIEKCEADEKEKEKQIQLKMAEEKGQYELLQEQEKLEKKKKAEAERKAAVEKEKREKKYARIIKIRHIWWTVEEYIGIGISAIFVLIIIGQTINMSSLGKLANGWIFFLILAVISIFLSGYCYSLFNDKLSIVGVANIIPAGLIGAFAVTCTVCGLWIEFIVNTFKEGFLVVIFSGWLVLLVFFLLVAVAGIIIIGVAYLLPAYLQAKLDDIKGGLVGLVISSIAAILYLSLVESDGVRIVLGM